MVPQESIERTKPKGKPRGRPFFKGYTPHNKGKPNATLLDDPGHQIGAEGGIIATPSSSSIVEPLNASDGINLQLPPKVVEAVTKLTETRMEEQEQKQGEPLAPLQLIESIEFTNGKNKVSLRLSKRHNRLYRVQIFLNDSMELRPSTYNGASTAYSFWNVLKEIMK